MNNKRKQYQKQYRQDYKSQVKRVNLTLNKTEYRDFSRAAKADDKRLTPYMKELALAGLYGQARIPNELQEELKTLRFAIRNIANNINQLTHYSHTIRELTSDNENNVLLHLKQLDDVVMQYTRGKILGK